MLPTRIGMKECGNDLGASQEREVIVSVIPNLPVRGLPVTVRIDSNGIPQQSGICVKGEGLESCAIKIMPHHSADRPLSFKLRTVCNAAQTADSTVQFEFQAVDHDYLQNPFWFGYKFPTINVFVIKSTKGHCSSVTDPHFTTFDKRTYDFQGIGTFVLYRNNFFGTEIHTRQWSCGGSASCNCGVAIKEYSHYAIYDMCNQDESWWRNGGGILRKRSSPNAIASGFFSGETPGGSNMDFDINLPSGVTVKISRARWGLSTYVKAPQNANEDSEGLCGNFNGDPNDDIEGDNFFESWRIEDSKSNFRFKGDPNQGKNITQTQCNGKICLCEGERVFCNTDEVQEKCNSKRANANAVPEPDQCQQGLRKKRDLNSRDDTIDDQDDIPLFEPPIRNNTITPATWPTPTRRLTKQDVTNLCDKKIRSSKAGETCGKITGVDIDALVQQCVSDIQITEDISWVNDNFAAMGSSCEANVYRNISFYKNTTNGELEVPTEVLSALCPNDCTDHGECMNTTCICHKDYTAKDCSISLKDSPNIFGIKQSGLCDIRRRPCQQIGIYGFPLLDSENLTCHIAEYKVIDSAWIPSTFISLYPGRLVDLTEVQCTLPVSPVNIDDYDNEGVTAAGLKIAVSNNRVNASKLSMLFISYDSVCQECNTTTGCTLKRDACLIGGHCFAINQSNPRDWCQQCLPENSTKSWTRRQHNQPPIFQTPKVLYAFYRKILRVQLRGDDPENRMIKFTLQNLSLSASLTENGLFTWTPNTNYSTSFVFKVYDECGSFGVLNSSVVIKECPCKNGGRCQPDHQYFDGSGKFTCLCNSGYNGTLCELDVDECVSSPCLNGTCKNEIPGFSCSCNPGYSGVLCDADVNECLSSPCFPGVQCYDKVNGYQCGPCPKGYNGTGETCHRIDGVDGNFTEWSDWSNCSVACDSGVRNRTRNCTNPAPRGTGKNCTGNRTEIEECNTKGCPVNGNFTKWSGWGKCNVSCGSGIRNRTRDCSNPAPINGGINCTGDHTETEHCKRTWGCADINECTKSPSVCHQNANCTNTNGSYSCQCLTGYSGDGKVDCTDINECTKAPKVCHQNANCTNTDGSYTCQCVKGYSGDGKVNCTENAAPFFTNPRKVYAILNKEFRMQIKAVDPEAQNLNYSLLGNWTENARLSGNGLLIIFVKESGNVSVKVEDEMGGQSIFILQIIAMACPCKNNGVCYKVKSSYPVDPSDYSCSCTLPHVGKFCESVSDPCEQVPCFPGLKCSPTGTNFTCEECPELFEGNGIKCNFIPAAETTTLKTEITLLNQKWNKDHTNKASMTYKKLVFQVTKEIRKVYMGYDGFSYVIVTGFRQGSVVVEFKLIFTKSVDSPLKPLQNVIRKGKLGNMTVEMNYSGKTTVYGKKILGLDKTIFIVVIIVIVLLVVMVSLAIYCRVKRIRVRRKEELRKRKLQERTFGTEPKGLTYEPSKDEADDVPQQMVLKTFANKAVLDDELKDHP